MRIVQNLRAGTAESNAQIFPEGTITYDTEAGNLRAHNGSTPGGNVIPNVSDINAFGTQEFTSVVVDSTPGQLLDAVMGTLLSITAAGTYALPTVLGKPVGTRLTIQATVAGVVIEPFAGQLINEAGVDLSTTTMNQHQILTLAVRDTSKWVVLNRY